MKITKTQLQTIIREEYVKVLFESQGKKISQSQAKILAENLEEGIWDSIGKGIEAYKSSRAEEKSAQQIQKNKSAVEKTKKDLRRNIGTIREQAKDILRKHGFVGPNETGVYLFEDAALEILGFNEDLKREALGLLRGSRKLPSKDESGAEVESGGYQPGMGMFGSRR